MRDLYNDISVTQPLNPVVSTTTKTSTAVDLQGFNSASILFSIGQSADSLSGSIYWTLKLQHSDDDLSYGDLDAADVLGSASIVVDSTSEDELVYRIGYVGKKRYLKGIATPTGTHSSGTPIGIIALRGRAAYTSVSEHNPALSADSGRAGPLMQKRHK